jgi:2'-5' RNA ligase
MRLFAALDLPLVVAQALSAAWAAARPSERELRAVPADQWHVTLAFYGEVAESAVPGLCDRLGRAAGRTAPMRLGLAGAGTFPKDARHARVVYTPVVGELAALIRLAEQCAAAGRRSGLDLPDRPYRPHLTLARARGTTVDCRRLVAALAEVTTPEWTAGELRLVHSRLGPPTTHELLAGWPMAHQA